jgi:hypothetical protein
MNKEFRCDAKRYDPDDEMEAEFDTWGEAESWFREQQKYGFRAIWLNGNRMKLHNGVLANNEPFEVPTQSAFSGLAQANDDFKRIFGRKP